MNFKKFISDYGAGLLWTGVSILLVTLLHVLGLFDLLNYKVLDFTFAQVRGPLSGWSAHRPIPRDSLKVVIVDIDDESWRLVPYPWPYPRDDIWARVVRNLTDAGARVIVFDLEFDKPDTKSDYLEALNRSGSDIQFRHGDEVLAEAIRYAQDKGSRVVLASKLVTEPTRIPPQYIQYPVDRLMEAGPEPALINEVKDFDGITRKYALAYELSDEPGRWYLPLALKALKEYWGLADSTLPRPNLDRNEITYGPSVIKTYGPSASIMVNFYGPPSGASLGDGEAWKTFDRYPLSNVLDDAEFDLRVIEEDSDWMDFFKLDSDLYGFVGESPFLDKIVLIGVSVNILLDVKATPFYNYAGTQQLMPGVEYHGHAIQTILDQNYIHIAGGTLELTRKSLGTNLLIITILGLITFLLIRKVSPILGAVLVLFELMAFLDISLSFFTSDPFWLLKLVSANLMQLVVETVPEALMIGTPEINASLFVPPIPGLATIALTYGSIVIYRFLMEQKDKRFLKSNFKTYVSPELIDQMHDAKQMPELGGESGIHTAYFTDIQSFSSFSEILSASELVALLNEYLTAMTDVLLEYRGTLDKYEGDAIVAFFGAPMPFDDHAYRACVVALKMQEALAGLREKWEAEAEKWPALVHSMRMRIGINAGDMVTGNMGSRTRMNYTMMGDVVNTAARLEASAKQYGIYIQTTLPTLELAGPDKFEWRYIDKVKVVGKSEAIEAVEVMALSGELPEDQVRMRDFYQAGLELYRKQEWDAAIEKFTASEPLEETFPKRPNTPSRVYIDRCGQFKADPPGPDWDGTWTLTSK